MSKKVDKQLKELRSKKGVSQQKVADEIGNNRVNYMNWENGYANPSYSDICKLASYFGVSTDFILNYTQGDED